MITGTTKAESWQDGIRVPPRWKLQATPAELRIKARLGYETVEPTIMSYLMAAVVLVIATVMAFASLDRDVPKWYDKFFVSVWVAFALFALTVNTLDRLYLRVDRGGVTTGIRPVPVSGFPFHRHIPRESIAGIYVAQCDLFVRAWMRIRRSYEVHALTTRGEAVRLLQRIPEAGIAEDLAVEIRKRLGPGPETPVQLLGQMRSGSDIATQVAGLIPAWSLWLGLALIGLEPLLLPVLRVARWERAPATVVHAIGRRHGRQSCSVRFTAPRGRVSAEVANRCSTSTREGDRITVYYDPDDPSQVRILTLQLWPISLIFLGLSLPVLIFGRERRQYLGSARILWRDRFRVVSPFWRLPPKQNAIAEKGALTVQGLRGAQKIPHTQWAFDPGAVELRVETSERAGREDGAGILFGMSCQGIGYVFGIAPRLQLAFARRVGPDWAVNRMPPAYVREIRAESGAWNHLRLEIRGGRAHFFVNGGRAGEMDYEPTPGGGMVGLYGDFGDGRHLWRFSDLVVAA